MRRDGTSNENCVCRAWRVDVSRLWRMQSESRRRTGHPAICANAAYTPLSRNVGDFT